MQVMMLYIGGGRGERIETQGSNMRCAGRFLGHRLISNDVDLLFVCLGWGGRREGGGWGGAQVGGCNEDQIKHSCCVFRTVTQSVLHAGT